MLNVQQIEALRLSNPQLYEALKRLAAASLGPNQGWSLDDQITDGSNFARVASNALTSNHIDPTKPGVLMRGSVPPTWSSAFTYISTTSSLTWSWSGLSIFRADGATTAIPNGSVTVTGLAPGATYYFYPYWDDVANALAWVAGGSGAGTPAYAQTAKTNLAAQQQALQGRIPLSQGAMVAATTTSGTGGGSGGGSGSCLRAGAMVLTKERGTVPIESCKVGEHLRCPSTGTARLRRDYRRDAAPSPSRAVASAGDVAQVFRPEALSESELSRGSSSNLAAGFSRAVVASSVEAGAFRPPKRAARNEGLQPRSDPRVVENPNEGWTRIVRLEVRDADTFIRLHFSNAESLDVTPHHIFTLADGSPMRAERLCLSDILVGRFGRLTLRKIEVISPNVAQVFRPEALSESEFSGGSSFNAAAGRSRTVVGSPSVEAGAFRPPKNSQENEGLQPRPSDFAVPETPWQKVTISCEPSHQFFAGRHSASILTHNYTFSS